MIIRWLVFAFFVIAVCVTGWFRQQHSPPQRAGYLAVRKLPINTRINSNLWILRKGDTPVASWDIPNPADLKGKYVQREVENGSPIPLEDLSDSPQLTFSKDTVPFTYKLEDLGPLSEYLNAGAKVFVCDQDTDSCSGGPYDVMALVGKDSQLALICLKSAQADAVRKIKKPTLRIAVLP
jgi:hypothetical protein